MVAAIIFVSLVFTWAGWKLTVDTFISIPVWLIKRSIILTLVNSIYQYSIFCKGQARTWQVIIMKGVANQSWLKTYWTKKIWEWNQWKHYKNFNKVNKENTICFGYFEGIQPNSQMLFIYVHTWPSWHMNVTLNPTGGAGVKPAVNMSGEDSEKNANRWK